MIDPEIERHLEDLRNGRLAVAGSFTLAASPATTTTVTRRICSSTSTVLLMPFDDGAGVVHAAAWKIVPANGSFVMTHIASVATATFRYVIFTKT